MKTFTEVYQRFTTGTGDDADTKVLPESRVTKLTEAASKEGKEAPQITHTQQFLITEAETDADFATLVPDEGQRVAIFNRGYIVLQQQLARQFVASDSFDFTDGSYDLKADAGEPRERRKATPQDKAKKILSGMSPEEIANLFAEFQAAANS